MKPTGRSLIASPKWQKPVASRAAQVALAWLLSKPVITAPIVGATKLHHLDDAIASIAV
jgi:aryl-alcohol dehydrogenase-like predicted oxidoreductase